MGVNVKGNPEVKSRELVHYIINKCSDPSKLGATKLNKILYYADFLFYMEHGKTITNETYVKQDHGPVPKHILQHLENLMEKGAISIREVPFFGKIKREYHSLTVPKISDFSSEEIAHIDEIVNLICNEYTASDISELTHNLVWEYAKKGEEIPPYTIFVPNFEPLDAKDLAWAGSVVEKPSKKSKVA